MTQFFRGVCEFCGRLLCVMLRARGKRVDETHRTWAVKEQKTQPQPEARRWLRVRHVVPELTDLKEGRTGSVVSAMPPAGINPQS
jgi:hypothetical protein